MKKLIAMSVVFALVLASCGGGNQSVTENSISMTTSMTAAGSSAMTTTSTAVSTTTTNGALEPNGKVVAVEDYVPYKVYVNNQVFYVYLDRVKLLKAIEDGKLPTHSAMSQEFEEMLILPYYFAYASAFDQNGVAVVVLQGGDYDGYAALIDREGNTVSDLSTKYSTMYQIKDKYVATRMDQNSNSPVGFDILDANGKTLKSFEDYPMPEGGYLYFKGGEVFDVITMDYVTGQPSEQGKFSRSNDLGNGYFGVADFSETEQDIDPNVFKDGVGHYKMALYKDGNLLTDFLYFKMVPLGDDLFYLYDGDAYYFYNAATGKRVFHHSSDVVMGDYDFTKHGSLIRANWAHGVIFITDNQVLEQSYPQDDGYTMFGYKRKNIRGVVSVIPYLIAGDMEDANVISILNSNIEGDITDVVPPRTNDTVGMFQVTTVTSVATLNAAPGVIHVQNLLLESDNTSGAVRDVFHEFFYDLSTGEHMWYEDWFTSPEQINALLLERAEQIYLANGAKQGPVEDPAAFFDFSTFARRVGFGPRGMILHIWSGLPPAEVSKEELKEMMKEEFYEKLVIPMLEKGSGLHK